MSEEKHTREQTDASKSIVQHVGPYRLQDTVQTAVIGSVRVSTTDIDTLTEDVIHAAWLATTRDDVRNVLVNFFCDLLEVEPSVFDKP